MAESTGGIYVANESASAQYLRQARLSLGLSRQQAADLAGCTAQTIGRYERNGISGRVLFSRVIRLCNAYGISLEHLCSLAFEDKRD